MSAVNLSKLGLALKLESLCIRVEDKNSDLSEGEGIKLDLKSWDFLTEMSLKLFSFSIHSLVYLN